MTIKKRQHLLLAVYLSFFLAMLIALACTSSLWLEMRVNIGYVFFSCWLFLFIFTLYYKSSRDLAKMTFFSFLLAVGVGSFLHGVKSLLVVPAAFIREGIHANFLSFSSINLAILFFLGVGLFFYSYLKTKDKTKF